MTAYRRDVLRGSVVLVVGGVLAALAGLLGVTPTTALAGSLAGAAAVAFVGVYALEAPALGPVWLGAALLAVVVYLEPTAASLRETGVSLVAFGLLTGLLWRVPAAAARLGERLGDWLR